MQINGLILLDMIKKDNRPLEIGEKKVIGKFKDELD